MAKYTHPRRPLHPGELLRNYAEDYRLTPAQLAEAIAIPTRRIQSLLRGKGRIDTDLALRLAYFFYTTPEFWLNMQRSLDLWIAERGEKAFDYTAIRCIKTPAEIRAFTRKLKEADKIAESMREKLAKSPKDGTPAPAQQTKVPPPSSEPKAAPSKPNTTKKKKGVNKAGQPHEKS